MIYILFWNLHVTTTTTTTIIIIIIIIIIISKCSKLAQKEYKTRYDCMGEVTHCELCKKFNFDHTNKWYIHNPVSALKNEILKILWDFEIQIDNQNPARGLDQMIIYKKKKKKKRKEKRTLLYSWLWRSGRPQSENRRKQKERQLLGLCQRTKKSVEHESNSNTNFK